MNADDTDTRGTVARGLHPAGHAVSVITAATRVRVTRTVQVSESLTLADLAEASGEDLADVVQSFKDRAGAEWINLHHSPGLVELVGGIESPDADVWTVMYSTPRTTTVYNDGTGRRA